MKSMMILIMMITIRIIIMKRTVAAAELLACRGRVMEDGV